MNSERYQKIYTIFSAAQEIPPNQRAEFLDEQCGGDQELRKEVEAFLTSDENLGDFIESPAIELAAKVIADEQTVAKIGQQIEHYKIISLLGAGGMGEVWLAEDVRLKRQIALKLISAVHKKDSLLRFEQEARAVSALNHPNIITIFDIGQSEEWEYIATEYINGKTLRELIKDGTLSLKQSIDIAEQICRALAAAHSAGIIHRDIKPENIMIRQDGLVKVLDFGLARFSEKNTSNLDAKLITTPGLVMGTVTYMSPEQGRGLSIDEKTDIFSLGIVLYEMLTGRQPFEGETGMDVLAAILKYEPQQLNQFFPEPIRNLVGELLQKVPSNRPSAVEVLHELQTISQSKKLHLNQDKPEHSHNNYGSQTIGLTTLTNKNPRRKTGRILPARVSSQPVLYKTIALSILLLAIFASSFLFYSYRTKNLAAAVILTENDPLMVADFENKTGDKDFDGKLFDQSIFTSLRQSPYILTTSYVEISEKLKEMGKSSTEPLTNDIAEEISRRLNGKAVLKGSIESHTSKYLIIFEAINPQTGESLAKEQAEADSKETVIDALDTALTAMRGKLGEPSDSVKQFSVPLKTAVSSSIPALKLFALAAKAEYEDKHDDAIVLYKRALEADPEYVIAYYSLGIIYSDKGQQKTAKECIEKAFNLRSRLTERDQPEITNFYYSFVTGEFDKEIESFESAKAKYPRDFTIPINLSSSYLELGDFIRSEENSRLALKQFPKMITPRLNLGKSLIGQSRFEQARITLQEAIALGAESNTTSPELFTIALALNNEGEMQRQLDSLKKSDEIQALLMQADSLIFAGKARDYTKLMNQAISRVAKDSPEIAGKYSAQTAIHLAAFGKCTEAENFAKRALDYDREQTVLTNATFVSALCDEKSQPLIDELRNKFPQNTIVNNIWLPVITAAAEMKDSPEKALETLEASRRYESATNFWSNYLRGKIYLKLNQPKQAAAEFQTILGNRGWAVESPLYVLAHLQLARAYEQQSEKENANKYSLQFAALRENADADLPAFK